MNNHTIYPIVAYAASAVLYLAYVTRLWSIERKLERRSRDLERR